MYQATHAIQLDSAIVFLPTLLNQLFSLLVLSPSSDVGMNIIRLLVHLVHLVQEAGRADILSTYVKVSTCFTIVILNNLNNLIAIKIEIIP